MNASLYLDNAPHPSYLAGGPLLRPVLVASTGNYIVGLAVAIERRHTTF